MGFPGGSAVRHTPVGLGDMGLIPELGRASGVGNGNLLHYSCLENSTDRRVWWATFHGVARSWTQLSD